MGYVRRVLGKGCMLCCVSFSVFWGLLDNSLRADNYLYLH